MHNQATEIMSSWEINIRAPYKQMLASNSEKEKQMILRAFISRTVRLFKKKIANLEEFENLDDLVCFVEQLLVVLNESHVLLKSELPGFDEKILPILEKYASLLVFESSRSHSQEVCMKKLVAFLNSLPAHSRSKLSPQARMKKIVTLLLDATRSEPQHNSEKMRKGETEVKESNELQNGTNNIQFNVNQPEASPVNCVKIHNSQNSKKGSFQSKQKGERKEQNIEPPTVILKSTVAIPEDQMDSKEGIQSQTIVVNGSKHYIEENCITIETQTPSENELDANQPLPLSLPSRHTDLQQLQKMLRSRFPISWNITPSEKYLLRRLLLLLKSKRPWKLPVWNISRFDFNNPEKLHERESSVQPRNTTELTANVSPKTSQDSTFNCDRSISPVSAQSALTPEKRSTSEQEESFLSCMTPQEDLVGGESNNQKEDPFEKLKNLNVNKTTESELTMSDVELMEEMEKTLRRLEKEHIEEAFDKSADLLSDALPCTSSLLENFPPSSSVDEFKLEKVAKNLNTKEKSSPTPSSSERRRSSRLAGLPALPLIFTQQPLPSKRKSSTASLTSKVSPSRHNNQEEEKTEAKQLEVIKEDFVCESVSKKPRYSDRVSLDMNLTPNLPKKPMRRRIVTLNPDPYLFIASDEELVELNKDLKQPREIKSSQRDSSKSLLSPDVVELSPCSDTDMEIVFSQIKTDGKAKENSKNESGDMMSITPESEVGSYRPGSSLKWSLAHDEKSNASIEFISMANRNVTNKNQLDQANTLLDFSKIRWQEIRRLLPACWADILEQHVKAHHTDEILLYQKPDGATSNIPTVYCCAAPEL